MVVFVRFEGSILVTGGSGQLGHRVINSLARRNFSFIAPSRLEFNLGDPNSVFKFFGDSKKTLLGVINCAAYTAVDAAEDNFPLAFAVNASSVGLLAKLCSQINIPFLHVSTDYVFDGENCLGYFECDSPNPINAYGKTKYMGECFVASENPDALIVRTSSVFDRERGNNFYRTMAELLVQKDVVPVVADQISCPTTTEYLADRLVDLIVGKIDCSGIFHIVEYDPMSWYQFACSIKRELMAEYSLSQLAVVRPIASKEFPLKAMRPKYSILRSSRTLVHV